MRNARAYVFPASPDGALALVRSFPGRAEYVAGGTALAERDDPGIDALVDLAHTGLEGVTGGPAGLRLGAMTTLEQLRRHPQVADLGDGVLAAALGRTRSEVWRNQATLGGRLREGAAEDLVLTVLLVLEARIEVLQAPRAPAARLPVAELAQLAAGDLILGVEIASEPGWRHALESLHQSALDRPVAAVCVGVRLESSRVEAVRVASCGLTSRPARTPEVEQALTGAAAGDDTTTAQQALAMATQPQDDGRASRAYRAHVGGVLLARALRRTMTPVPGA